MHGKENSCKVSLFPLLTAPYHLALCSRAVERRIIRQTAKGKVFVISNATQTLVFPYHCNSVMEFAAINICLR